MKKGPNLRWSLIHCSGGDEGDRTPDLLTASQALSQLSYAPVRRSTIRELPRRCKDIFGKTFAGAGPGAPDRVRSARKARGARPAGGRRRRPPFRRPGEASRPAARRLPLPGRDSHCAPTAIPPATVPLLGPIAFRPDRPFQNHAGLRGQAGNPRACRNQRKQNRR